MNKLITGTYHNGQELPAVLQNREFIPGTYVCDESWFDLDDQEADEIRSALRALDVSTETDSDGLYVVEVAK